jgi:hypothetical protein
MRQPLATLLVVLGVPGVISAGEEGGVDYLRDVKPILSRRCYACHGALQRKSGLRLDTATAIRRGGDTGPAIVAGQAAESLLIEAVTGADGWRMPPEGEPLSDPEILRLRSWIDQGAKAPPEPEPADPRAHWAFRPPVRPAIPAVRDAAWTRNPIDAFLAAEYEKRGLRPRPAADPATLLRRVALDLVGLAPTPDELHAFLADPSRTAYEQVVDRLLASPAYGERWGRHWMDVWRYSDWDGYAAEVRESQPHIWHWRDWIIESLNRDQGYDAMVVAMLAADEAAPGDLEAARATGFLVRNWYKFNRNVWLENLVEHTSKAFLGITLNCARCHDHKYDPIEQGDFYKFRAFFEPHAIRTDRVPGEPDVARDGLPRVYDADSAAPTFLFRRGDEKAPVKDQPLAPALPRVLAPGNLEIRPVSLPPTASYPGLSRFFQDETLAQARTAVDRSQAALARTHRDRQLVEAWLQVIARVRRTRDNPRLRVILPAARALDAVTALAARLEPSARARARRCSAAAALAEKTLAAARAIRTTVEAKIAADRARYARPPRPDAELLARLAGLAERRAAFLKADEDRLRAEQSLADARSRAPATDRAAQKAVADAEKKQGEARKALETARAALAGEDAPAYSPLSPVFPASSTGRRLALARWIAGRDNPLTARVAVNHIWLRHFGAPMVSTVFDFGRNGKPPTHPALLDWLAVELMDQAWCMKAIHRLIVTSNAYCMQSSAAGPDDPNRTVDPGNQYLWRMNPRRMEAEAIRDNVLRVAGNLDATMGGPDLDPESGQTSRRRSLYFRHAKEKRMTFLRQFDSPNVSACYRRSESVVPQQALALANSAIGFEQARRLAGALSAASGLEPRGAADAGFIARAFEAVLGRPPTAEEDGACAQFLVEQAERLADRSRLTSFAAGPAGAVKAAGDPRLRAREDLVHVLLNHNDFVTIR